MILIRHQIYSQPLEWWEINAYSLSYPVNDMLLQQPQMTKTYTQRCREKTYNQIVLKEIHLIDIIKTYSEIHIAWWRCGKRKWWLSLWVCCGRWPRTRAVCSQNLSGSVPGSLEQTYIMNTMWVTVHGANDVRWTLMKDNYLDTSDSDIFIRYSKLGQGHNF